MALIKKLNLDETSIEIYDDYIPQTNEEKKQNLIRMYDVVNDIAKSLNYKKTKSWFLSNKELKIMKESGKYNFI